MSFLIDVTCFLRVSYRQHTQSSKAAIHLLQCVLEQQMTYITYAGASYVTDYALISDQQQVSKAEKYVFVWTWKCLGVEKGGCW